MTKITVVVVLFWVAELLGLSQLVVLAADTATPHAGTFWQLTDIHWDAAYTRSGNASNWCHRGPPESGLAGGDARVPDNGYYGNYSCDPPWTLVRSAVAQMAAVQSQPDFILWTGDNAPHWETGPDFSYIMPAIKNITHLLQLHFPNSTLIPCLGNHDTFPANQYPGRNSSSTTQFYRRFLDEAGWRHVITDRLARATFVTGGYYALTISPRLTVVVLNTNIYYRTNSRVSPDHQPDPDGQLAWLHQQLARARTSKYQVIVVGHIAPGYFERLPFETFMYERYNEALARVLVLYHDVVVTQLYGHSHTDSFRVFSTPQGDGVEVSTTSALIAPSVTPWVPEAATNPGVRLFRYRTNPHTVILGYSQFVLNLSQANAATSCTAGASECWRLLYDTETSYRLANLSTASLYHLWRHLSESPGYFSSTYLHYNTGGYETVPQCNNTCRLAHLCAIRHVDQLGFQRCVSSNESLLSSGVKSLRTGTALLLLAVCVSVSVCVLLLAWVVGKTCCVKRNAPRHHDVNPSVRYCRLDDAKT